MRCPRLSELPSPPQGKSGWPWTEESPALPEYMSDGSLWPRISIVTPSYNQGQFIEETIRSVLLQGYPDLEYIVIDGGSTDESADIIRKYEPWLAYWVSERDRGQSHAINKGFQRATGDLITFQNSDDVYLEGAFQDAAVRWEAQRDAGVVAGAFYFIDEQVMRPDPVPARLPHQGPIDLAIISPERWRIHQVSAFFSRHALDTVGRFVREDLNYNMDRELLYRVCRVFSTSLSDSAYGAFRWHGSGKSVSNVWASDKEHANLHLSYHYDDCHLRAQCHKVANIRLAKGYLRYARGNGHFFASAHALVRACRLRPSIVATPGYLVAWVEILHLLPSLRWLRGSLRGRT